MHYAWRRRMDVIAGIRLGLGFAVAFSVIAAAIIALQAGTSGAGGYEAAKVWAIATAFYLAAGAAGGAVFGLLRPVQHRYWGRYLTAYLILFLVYGGATATILPLTDDEPVPVLPLLAIWAVICLAVAPICVAIARVWSRD